MRYERKKDWVEISGAADRPMRELLLIDGESMDAAHNMAVEVTKDAHFEDRHGNEVDWRGNVFGLSVRQWNWWKAQVWAAAKDEKIDPEA